MELFILLILSTIHFIVTLLHTQKVCREGSYAKEIFVRWILVFVQILSDIPMYSYLSLLRWSNKHQPYTIAIELANNNNVLLCRLCQLGQVLSRKTPEVTWGQDGAAHFRACAWLLEHDFLNRSIRRVINHSIIFVLALCAWLHLHWDRGGYSVCK